MRVAIVERDEKVLEELKKGLKRVDPNYELAGIAGNGQSAYEMITVMQPNLVIMDIGLPRMNGLNLLRKLRTEGREFRVIIITKDEDFQQAKQAIDLGVDGYLVQPFRPMELKKALSRIHEKIRNEYWMQASFTVENILLSCRYGEIISNQKLNEMTIRKFGLQWMIRDIYLRFQWQTNTRSRRKIYVDFSKKSVDVSVDFRHLLYVRIDGNRCI